MNRKLPRHSILGLFATLILSGCHWDLWDQARYEPFEQGDFWGEGESSSRPLVEGTVPFGGARLDTALYKGMDADGNYIAELPEQIVFSKELLERGQERFNIYCIVCHGETGQGNGIIVKRGFPAPPSYMDDRLREVNIGYFYDVMTNGFGRMYSYKSRVPVEDRWAIAAYIRVMQFSQHATPDLLTEELLNLAQHPPEAKEAVHHDDSATDAGQDEESNEHEEEGQSEH
jgi:mono/diheme cytochrome c family protein